MAKRTPPPKPKAFGIATTTWKAFTIKGIDVRLWKATYKDAEGCEVQPLAVPTLDPDYVFREDMVRELAWAVWPHDQKKPYETEKWTPCLISGPKGSGKTSLVTQIAARCNIPVYRANLNVGTTVRHLKGRLGAEGGKTVFVPGIATMAMEQGAWLLLDEISGVSTPVGLSLFPVLEPDGAVLLEDAQPPRYVNRAKTFRLFGTDNTLGAMQEEDRFLYSGTNPDMNAALLDRFGAFIEVPYLKDELEHRAVAGKVPTIDSMDLEGMIRVANAVRESREIGAGFSTRMLFDWARRVAAGKINGKGKVTRFDSIEDDRAILDAADGAFLRKQPSEIERTAISEIIRRIFEITGD